MRNLVVQTKAIRTLLGASFELEQRPSGMSGICVVHGGSGFGKTTATAYILNQQLVDGIYVRALSTWTPSSMLAALSGELGIKPLRPCARAVDAIVRRLCETGWSVFVDEADYLLRGERMLDTLRDLHDLSTVPLILIGMDRFRDAVAHREQFAGRIYRDVRFTGLDETDARLVADQLCDRAIIADDLVAAMLKETHGSIRRYRAKLTEIEAFAWKQGIPTIGLSDWQEATRIARRGAAPAAKFAAAA